MKIGIHGKEFNKEIQVFIKEVFHALNNINAEIYLSDSYCEILKEADVKLGTFSVYQLGDDLTHLDCFFTLGGDGTLLQALTHIASAEIPILGINTGRLGFLATTARDDFQQALQSLVDRRYTYEKRTLLRLETSSKLFDGLNFALNDFTILKKDTTSMIVVHAFIDGEFLNSYWADGIILATPTGSTGYSVSCGGPIVLPQSNNFVLTPVSPHNLTVRPMIVPDDCELSFRIEGRSKNFLISLDSRYETIDDTVDIIVKKEDFCAKLIKLDENNYFKTLRQKLNWGYDIRN